MENPKLVSLDLLDAHGTIGPGTPNVVAEIRSPESSIVSVNGLVSNRPSLLVRVCVIRSQCDKGVKIEG